MIQAVVLCCCSPLILVAPGGRLRHPASRGTCTSLCIGLLPLKGRRNLVGQHGCVRMLRQRLSDLLHAIISCMASGLRPIIRSNGGASFRDLRTSHDQQPVGHTVQDHQRPAAADITRHQLQVFGRLCQHCNAVAIRGSSARAGWTGRCRNRGMLHGDVSVWQVAGCCAGYSRHQHDGYGPRRNRHLSYPGCPDRTGWLLRRGTPRNIPSPS